MNKIALWLLVFGALGCAYFAYSAGDDDKSAGEYASENSYDETATDDEDTPAKTPQLDLLKVKTLDNLDEQLIDYEGFCLSFNPVAHIPNWVSWELLGEEVEGDVSRKEFDFYQDPEVRGCPGPKDYKGSGFSRGHMCPAADMKWSRDAMDHCHSMANMCPQNQSFNSGPWGRLENKCRKWAVADSAIIIVSGPVYSVEPLEFIGPNKDICVPGAFFKVVLAPYADPPRGIGFIMPNGKVPGGMQAAAVSIDQVEEATGYDFFSALPDEIEDAVEAQCNFNAWPQH